MPAFLIEFRAGRHRTRAPLLERLLQTTLSGRAPEQGRGWRSSTRGVVFGLHERGSGPGDRLSLPYFPVRDLAAAVECVRELSGGIVYPGERWAICRDSEGTRSDSPARPS
jgi:hypothetical protein